MFFKKGTDFSKTKDNEEIIDMLSFDYAFELNDETLLELKKYYFEYFKLREKYYD